jgi:hypothetical protein
MTAPQPQVPKQQYNSLLFSKLPVEIRLQIYPEVISSWGWTKTLHIVRRRLYTIPQQLTKSKRSKFKNKRKDIADDGKEYKWVLSPINCMPMSRVPGDSFIHYHGVPLTSNTDPTPHWSCIGPLGLGEYGAGSWTGRGKVGVGKSRERLGEIGAIFNM